MSPALRHLRISRAWLLFACTVAAALGIATSACAAHCATARCSEAVGQSQPLGNDALGQLMLGGCNLCASVTPSLPIIAEATLAASPDYFPAKHELAMRYIQPDVPPPRI